MWLSKSHNALVWWGFEDENAKFIGYSGLTYVVEPIIEDDVREGSTLGTLTIKGESPQNMIVSFAGEYTIDKIEDVKTPAGNFKDCIKVHEIEYTPDGKIDFYVWYAPDVGPVKYEYPNRNDRVDILEDYDIVDDDPFETWILPKVPYMVVASVVGIISVVITIFILRKKKNI